jgi:serine/threonine protein kinase
MAELKKLGRYEILSEIGRGGMSTVYLAHDPFFDRDVALKLLPREFLHDPGFKARFGREAKAIAKLEHSAIVPVYDFGEENGQPYLVMRHMTGGSLANRLKQGCLDLDGAAKVVTRLASALKEAHKHGMIHRDIKPGNVLFDQYGDAFLTDFGIVKLTQETSTYTGSGIIGTPAYMSPEQARGEADIDLRSDVYALGAILFEMLTGKPPFQSETVMGLALKHITDPIPSILALQPDLPEGLEKLIQTAMCKERDGRYDSAMDLADALKAIISKEVGTIVTDREPQPETVVSKPEIESTVIEQVAPKAVQVPMEPGEEALPKLRLPRRKMIWGLGAVGIIVVGALLVMLIPKLGLFLAAPAATSTATSPPPPTPLPTVEPMPAFPPVVGPDPSTNVGLFYYPRYGNPEKNGSWIGWQRSDLMPPLDIASDYYPLLGLYSSTDPAIVAQHFAWMREAGVGVVISSWWGPGSFEDQAVPLLLEMGEQYGIKIAFNIEPYEGRSNDKLPSDVQYLYDRYGQNPAFYRTQAGSRRSLDDRKKGLFFLRLIDQPSSDAEPVGPEYWRSAIDAIHDLPDGGLVIANTTESGLIDNAHFDGIYHFAAFEPEEGGLFTWALDIPPGGWYVPSVMPGFSSEFLPGQENMKLPRASGETYHVQWNSALGMGVEPQMVTITSFNGWFMGNQIEPAAPEMTNEQGHEYSDYRPLDPGSYLMITREWAGRLATMEWPPAYRARIRITSSSDWTDLLLIEGGSMTRPNLVELSKEAGPSIHAGVLALTQKADLAEAGSEVQMVIDVLFTNMNPQQDLIFRLERGHLGTVEVELMNYVTNEPIPIETFRSGELHEGEADAVEFSIPASKIINPPI